MCHHSWGVGIVVIAVVIVFPRCGIGGIGVGVVSRGGSVVCSSIGSSVVIFVSWCQLLSVVAGSMSYLWLLINVKVPPGWYTMGVGDGVRDDVCIFV